MAANTHCFRRTRTIALSALALLMFYVLSVGPAMKLEDSGYLRTRTANAIYTPLTALARIPEVGVFFHWYIFRVWKADTMGDNTI